MPGVPSLNFCRLGALELGVRPLFQRLMIKSGSSMRRCLCPRCRVEQRKLTRPSVPLGPFARSLCFAVAIIV